MKDNNLEGKLLVHFNEGSYVLWRGYPDLLISSDGRYEEVYPKSTFDTAMQAYAKAPSIRLPALAKLGPDYILVCKSSTPQLHDSDYPEQWSRLYQDNRCFLLETK
jgi:hypothetical protein